MFVITFKLVIKLCFKISARPEKDRKDEVQWFSHSLKNTRKVQRCFGDGENGSQSALQCDTTKWCLESSFYLLQRTQNAQRNWSITLHVLHYPKLLIFRSVSRSSSSVYLQGVWGQITSLATLLDTKVPDTLKTSNYELIFSVLLLSITASYLSVLFTEHKWLTRIIYTEAVRAPQWWETLFFCCFVSHHYNQCFSRDGKHDHLIDLSNDCHLSW